MNCNKQCSGIKIKKQIVRKGIVQGSGTEHINKLDRQISEVDESRSDREKWKADMRAIKKRHWNITDF